jgi:F0F1-type ATP synthase membrane subunit a
LTSANKICPLLLTPILFRSQIALAGLEVAVAFIQAYVFRVLITLYTSERIN